MQYALWAGQILLGVAFLMSGVVKVIQPIDALVERMVWVADVPPELVRFIGAAETLGGIGLIAPAATRILPWLTPLAAAGLALDMLLATLFHVVRGELAMAVVTIVLGAIAGAVAYGRWALVPIRPRGAAPAPPRESVDRAIA